MLSDLKLVIAGYEVNRWDNAIVDAAIDTPAAAWSLALFDEDDRVVPAEVTHGAKVQMYYKNELILNSVADAVEESVDRSGYALKISGRDLIGQLIDCSVPIFNGRQVTLDELLNQFLLKSELGALFTGIDVQDNSWLKNKASVEPGESLWDAINRTAQVTGQHVWMRPNGTLVIGDPFKNNTYIQTPLRLHRPDMANNVMNAHYSADISNAYSEIKVLGQNNQAQHILSTAHTSNRYPFKRSKIVNFADVETQAEADAAVQKYIKDNDLNAYGLTATVYGWQWDGMLWRIASYLNFESNRLVRASAKWAVMGRTFTLTRQDGFLTQLRMNRQGDWAQPLKHKDKAPAKTKAKTKEKTK